jgi:putative flippase GtrA
MSGEDGASDRQAESAAGHQSRLRHWLGFLASGLIALAVDATVLEVGVRLFALDPLVARLAAISTAMVAGWLAHRRLTFAVTAPATLAELARYCAAAWSSAAVNYGAFAAMLLVWPATPRLAALVSSSAIAMFFSYVAMRYAVFRVSRN